MNKNAFLISFVILQIFNIANSSSKIAGNSFQSLAQGISAAKGIISQLISGAGDIVMQGDQQYKTVENKINNVEEIQNIKDIAALKEIYVKNIEQINAEHQNQLNNLQQNFNNDKNVLDAKLNNIVNQTRAWFSQDLDDQQRLIEKSNQRIKELTKISQKLDNELQNAKNNPIAQNILKEIADNNKLLIQEKDNLSQHVSRSTVLQQRMTQLENCMQMNSISQINQYIDLNNRGLHSAGITTREMKSYAPTANTDNALMPVAQNKYNTKKWIS